MYPYIHIILPSYAVFAFLGASCALIFLYFRSCKIGMEFGHFVKAFVVSVFGLVLGSKILFMLTQIPNLLRDFTINGILLQIMRSGFVYYGGLLGMLAGLRIYITHRTDYDLTVVYNMVTPAIPLFHAFGRIGCFMTGCCYGAEIEPAIVLNNHIQINRVPTQLIEVLFETVMFIVLLCLGRKKDRKLLGLYMVAYSIFRFCLEFFRGDLERGVFLNLSTSQWISLLIGAWYIYRVLKNKEKRSV